MSDKPGLEEVWRLAIQNEQEAQEIYQEMAEMVEDSSLKNLFAFLGDVLNKAVCVPEITDCFLQVNNVNTVASPKNIRLHLRVPTTGLVAEMNTSL